MSGALATAGTAALDLGAAVLKVTPAAGFQPTPDTVVAVIVNQKAPAAKGTFQNLEGGARLVTTEHGKTLDESRGW